MSATHRPRTMLVTGGAGFIGTNFIRHVLDTTDAVSIVNLDALTYAGSEASLHGIDERHPGRHRFVRADIRERPAIAAVFAEHNPDTVVNFAAESHVDRSIDNPLDFVETNVLGTAVLLDAARRHWQDRSDVRFHHVSTDEVYGSLGPDGFFREDSPYDPSSPYSASKAGADHLVRAWMRTYGLPATITNCSNNFGPWQFPEKLIPLMIANALEGKALPVYGQGANIRDWLHVEDHARALMAVITRGSPGSTYNIGAGNEWTNTDLVRLLCTRLDAIVPRAGGKSYADLITFVADRPGHDARYAIDSSRLTDELDWRPQRSFPEAMDDTIRWYLDHRNWLDDIRNGTYDGSRLGRG